MITRLAKSSLAQDLPRYRSMLAGNDAYVPPSFESISSTTLTTTTSTITFSSIPSTYQHLQIRFAGLTPNTNNNGFVYMQLNGNTGANYSDHWMGTEDGSTTTANAGTSRSDMRVLYIRGTTTGEVFSSVCIIDIHDYGSTSKYKTIRAIGGFDTNGSGQKLSLNSGSWRSTSAVTSITLGVLSTGATDSFRTGTVASLYGILGA